MNVQNKWKVLVAIFLTCFIGFLIPFYYKTAQESINSVLSTSFTILCTLFTAIALILAFVLFDKFGIN